MVIAVIFVYVLDICILVMLSLFSCFLSTLEFVMYFFHRGYGYSFEWTGDYKDDAPRDRWGRRQIYVVAMDAVKYRSNSVQFRAG